MKHRPTTILTLVALFATACSGSSGDATDRPSPSRASLASPSASALPASSAPGPESAAPSADGASAAPLSDELPTRLVVADLDIDLPVVSGDLTAPGNPPDYPLCGVAQYLTIFRYPGRPGTTTWIYGHARPGMLLRLLEASTVDDGAALIGRTVELYSDAGNRFTYRVSEVRRHATDRTAARGVAPTARRLVLQTSEGPRGTVPKLQVVAELIDVAPIGRAEAMPEASPVGCFGG